MAYVSTLGNIQALSFRHLEAGFSTPSGDRHGRIITKSNITQRLQAKEKRVPVAGPRRRSVIERPWDSGIAGI